MRTTHRPPPGRSRAQVTRGSAPSHGAAPTRSRAVRGRLRDSLVGTSARSVVVLTGAVGASLLAFGLALFVPQQTLALTFLLVAALPICAVIVRWTLTPQHVTVRGARFVLTHDGHEWAVVRRPLGQVLTDSARFSACGEQRALVERVVAAYASGRAEEIEVLRILDRAAALERLVSDASRPEARSELTPQQRTVLGAHVRASLDREISLLESRQGGHGRWPAPLPRLVAPGGLS
jgi:type IV secretory pathway TrbD component